MRRDVRKQSADTRKRNFDEVSLGFSDEDARTEAKRCLQCKKPRCVLGCPVGIDIPGFIKLLAEGRRREALIKIKEKNTLPAICGRVCPQEEQCELNCILNKKGEPINIGALERFASDIELTEGRRYPGACKVTDQERIKVAVAGSGPAGLTCAAELAKKSYKVTLFESLHIAGGVLTYGIPEFRLPKTIVHSEIEYVRSLGVDIKTNYLIGSIFTINELFKQGYKAIFLGLGAGLPQFLGIKGENLDRVYSANEFLTRLNLMKAYIREYATPINIGEKVAVVGGGNVAFDCARCAVRLGKEVTLVYRRTEEQMPARKDEIKNAKEEGVQFSLLTQPIEILSDSRGFVKGIKCVRMKLGSPDKSGRPRPVEIKDSQFIMDIDTVIVAIGQRPNPLLANMTPELKTNENGTIRVNADLMTSIPGVFAGGDITTGADTVIKAMGAGKQAAVSIDRYIRNNQ